jgi:hypothetical protein
MPDEVMAPVPKDSPLMKAWESYKAGPNYKNTRNWAVNPDHTEGSLWAAFVKGWSAAGGADPFAR